METGCGLYKSHTFLSAIGDSPNALVHIVRNNQRLKGFAELKFTIEFDLIGKTAPYPVGLYLVTLSVNSYVKRLNLAVFIKGGNYRDNTDRHIIV